MNFKIWLTENESEFIYPNNISPRNLLGSGKFATVYSTNHPHVVMRVEQIKSPKELQDIKPEFHNQACEKFMMKPDIQETGGVAKIYNSQITQYDFQDNPNPLFITYKEKVDTDWIPQIVSKYGKQADNLLSLLNTGLLAGHKDKNNIIQTLNQFPETQHLAHAVQLGLPTLDLHTNNVGLNQKGHLVAIDC